jgi:predicted ArsR family transcriptional regulator
MVTRALSDSPERTHDAVLLHLKRQGEMTVSELCQALGITAMAVRRHLTGLQQEGLVNARIVKQLRGRPTYRYRLTEKAEGLFPAAYDNFATELLDTVYEMSGHKGVMELLNCRHQRLVDKLKPRFQNKDLRARVEEVSKYYSENGFMTEWEQLPDGNFIIFQRHCAVHDLANRYRQMCVLEPRLIEELLEAKVTRQQYMLKNDPVCGYLVQADP